MYDWFVNRFTRRSKLSISLKQIETSSLALLRIHRSLSTTGLCHRRETSRYVETWALMLVCAWYKLQVVWLRCQLCIFMQMYFNNNSSCLWAICYNTSVEDAVNPRVTRSYCLLVWYYSLPIVAQLSLVGLTLIIILSSYFGYLYSVSEIS